MTVMSELLLTQAGVEDLPQVAALAERVWWTVYPPIIGEAQVRYMLARMYDLDALRRDHDRGVAFMLVGSSRSPNEAIGFYALDLSVTGQRAFLDKLYVLPEWHGAGVGQQMLASVCTLAVERGFTGVMLRVNRHNERAIRAYERFGFRELDRVCTEIGDGFRMDDIRFVWDAEPDPSA